jgi:hypothetical protein
MDTEVTGGCIMNTTEVQEQLATIEQHTMSVAGYLSMLSKLGAIHPRFAEECERHLNELGEIYVAIVAIKKELDTTKQEQS